MFPVWLLKFLTVSCPGCSLEFCQYSRSYSNLNFHVQALSHSLNREKTLINGNKITAEGMSIVRDCSTDPGETDWGVRPIPPGEEKTVGKPNSSPHYEQGGYSEDRVRLCTGQEMTGIS